MTLVVYNDGHQFHVPEDAPHIGIYTSSWGTVLDFARDRGATRIVIRDTRTGEIVGDEHLNSREQAETKP